MNYVLQEMIDKISCFGILVVVILLCYDVVGEQVKMNLILVDEEQVYNCGLCEGIMLIGDIVNKLQEVKVLIEVMDKGCKMVNDCLQLVFENEWVCVYMVNLELIIYGFGKYIGLMMVYVGVLNVVVFMVKGFKQVIMEQVIVWDLQVIFVQNCYLKVVNEILYNFQWQVIDVVKYYWVYLMLDYVKVWGYLMLEVVGIGELWMVKKFYLEKFYDIDM